jgi:hypothetical protein
VALLQVLKQLPLLRNLNLKGCPICERAEYPSRLLRMLPGLDILDGKRISAAVAGDAPAAKAGFTQDRAASAAEARPKARKSKPAVAADDAQVKPPESRAAARAAGGNGSEAPTGTKKKAKKRKGLADEEERSGPEKDHGHAGAGAAAGTAAGPGNRKKAKRAAEAADGTEGSRSFLEEVLLSAAATNRGMQEPAARPGPAMQSADAVGGTAGKGALASGGGSSTRKSGVVRVVDLKNGRDRHSEGKVSKKGERGGTAPMSSGPSLVVTGAAAAQMLLVEVSRCQAADQGSLVGAQEKRCCLLLWLAQPSAPPQPTVTSKKGVCICAGQDIHNVR